MICGLAKSQEPDPQVDLSLARQLLRSYQGVAAGAAVDMRGDRVQAIDELASFARAPWGHLGGT